jgi:hypothetical protein
LKVPEVLALPAVNVAPAEMAVPDAVNEVIASPSGSTAATVNVMVEPSTPDAVAGASTEGGRSHPLPTVIVVAAEPLRAFWAVKVAV